jgi:hypothetical protein
VLGSRFQSVLNRVTSPEATAQDRILARRLHVSRTEQRYQYLEAVEPGFTVVVLYVGIALDGLSEIFLGAKSGGVPSSVSIPACALEVHLCVPSCSPLVGGGISSSVGADEVFALPTEAQESDVLGLIRLMSDAISVEYRSVVCSSHQRDIIDATSLTSAANTQCLTLLSACIRELHSEEGAHLPSMLKQIEGLLRGLPDVAAVSIDVQVAQAASSSDEVRSLSSSSRARPPPPPLPSSSSSSPVRALASPEPLFVRTTARSTAEATGPFSPAAFLSPGGAAGPSLTPLSQSLSRSQATPAAAAQSAGPPASPRPPPPPPPAAAAAATTRQLRFDFQCYEVFGQLLVEVKDEAGRDDPGAVLGDLLSSFVRALGRRCYELYRGQRSKKQLVDEQKKAAALTGEVTTLRYALTFIAYTVPMHTRIE